MTKKRHIGRSNGFGALLFCLILLAGMILPFSQIAFADNGAVTVRVGYYENEVFQEGARPDAVKTGYAYEYYQKLSEYTGWKYEYVYGEFGDLYHMLLDGKIDLLAGLAWREDRTNLIGYPDDPMGHETYNLVKHAADDAITVDYSTLSSKRIGVLDSAMADVLQDFLESHHIASEVIRYRDYEPLFNALTTRRSMFLRRKGTGHTEEPTPNSSIHSELPIIIFV